ncbi:hypothetical protein KSD_39390 [Ktedonobacter sp. SOSP1-85]|uniref:response regulator transcription factor n=1 Tax=Ktedonobacter sp. SOSP1-85 TaxID=2778367 RepID=UPI0019152EB2|nr:response regulator transcription factor [Ktedonobacter sp. SOSP1-85]GHO76168.1 hypothetical protein KSD_39390 [Ktedonobacter sp. SOSP1-85]
MVKILIVDDHSLMRRAVREVLEKEADFNVVAEASTGQEAEAQAQQTQPDVILMDMDMPDCNGFDATERVLAHSPHSRVIIFTAAHEDVHVFRALQRGAMGYITKDIEPDALIHAVRCAARNDLCIPGALASQVLAYIRNIWRTQEQFYTTRFSPEAIAYRTPRRVRRAAKVQALHENATSELLNRTTGELEEQVEVDEKADDEGDEEAAKGDKPRRRPRPLTGREREILDLMRLGRKNREIAKELCIAESTVHKHVQNIFEKLRARNRTEAIYFTSMGGQFIGEQLLPEQRLPGQFVPTTPLPEIDPRHPDFTRLVEGDQEELIEHLSSNTKHVMVQ